MTILPKKKVGKEKNSADSESHEHQTSDAVVSGRARLESTQHRSLEHRVSGRLRVATDAVPPIADTSDLGKDDVEQQSSSENQEARQQCAVKRRHGRLSPLSQPYTRGKNIRGVAPPSSNETDTSDAKYLHIVDHDRRSISPPTPGGSRTARRRQRSRIESKEELRTTGNNSDDEYDTSRLTTLHQGINFEELELEFVRALKQVRGFYIKEMVQDGACLFRAVADQVYGDQNMNDEVRRNCMDYMMKNCDFFSNFVTEDYVSYIARKRLPHTHGNHLEMQAMAEIYNRNFEVFQYSTEPINTFQSSSITENEPIRVSYHRNTHYNSVVNPYKASVGVGLGLPSFRPGLADEMLLESAQRESEQELLEQQMLQDKLLAADWENTEEEMLREVANNSFADYLSHHQKIAKNKQADSSSVVDEHEPCSSSTCQPRCFVPTSPAKCTSSSTTAVVTAQLPDTSSPQQETSSTSTFQQNFMLGIPGQGDWVDESDENTILAQVMAQSHREYYESLTKGNNQSSSSSSSSSSAGCSKYP